MAVGGKWSGRNLLVTIGGEVVPCIQSFSVTPSDEFVEYKCVGSDGTKRIYDGRNWSSEATCLLDNDDQTFINSVNAAPGTPQAIIAYPDGNVAGQIKISFNAFVAMGAETSRGSAGSSAIQIVPDGDVTFGTATGS